MRVAQTRNPKPKRKNNRDLFAALKKTLLSLGGESANCQPDPHLGLLLSSGRVFDASRRKKVRGMRNRCHQFAGLYYVRNQISGSGRPADLATGYALANSGVWCSHSWLWDGERVIETTADFKAYYGVVLEPDAALKFVFNELVAKLPGWDEISGSQHLS